MMKRLAVSLTIAVLAIGSASAAQPIELPLTLVKATSFGGRQRLKISLAPPKGRYKMPKFQAPKPLYSTMKLGDKDCLVVADFSSKTTGWYDRIYIDANGNKDLTDDKVINAKQGRGRTSSDYKISQFDAVEVKVEMASKKSPYYLMPRIYGYRLKKVNLATMTKLPRTIYFEVTAACHYATTLRNGAEALYIVLADSNGNGRFDDVMGDQVFASLRQKAGRQDGAALCSRIAVGKDLYEPKVDVSKKILSLNPVRGELGYISLPFKAQNIVVQGKVAVLGLNVKEKMCVPVGEYRLRSYVCSKKKGDEYWRLTARGSNAVSPVKVLAGRTAKWQIGETYTTYPTIAGNAASLAKKSKSLRFGVHTKGAGGEVVASVEYAITSENPNGRRIKAPTYTVTTDGKNITNGSFRYG